jgi:hypothetical protein
MKPKYLLRCIATENSSDFLTIGKIYIGYNKVLNDGEYLYELRGDNDWIIRKWAWKFEELSCSEETLNILYSKDSNG